MRIDLNGRRALVAGVADDTGFGFAIAKALSEAGASVCVAAWPPAMGIFETKLRRGKMDESRKLSDGSLLEFEKVYALDAAYDSLADVPQEIAENKRYAERGDYTVQGLAQNIKNDFGQGGIDVVVHALANGPEVAKSLMETSRKGYLSAVSVSAYSMVSLVKNFAPLMPKGGSFLSLTYLASQRAIPHYGGGMSAAKAALESDTRLLALEGGRRYGIRVNTLSAGPYASRAASVTGAIDDIVSYYRKNGPISESITPNDVANTACFLSSPLASAITGSTVYVDYGFHAMGKGLGEHDAKWVMGEH